MISHNTQLLALSHSPPARLTVAGAWYEVAHLFKHDFYAATYLYEASAPARFPRIVVKFYRTQVFCGLPMRWAGRLMRNRERAAYAALAGVQGVPRWVAQVGATGLAVEYVPGRTLAGLAGPPPPGFFERLKALFDEVHARGVGYCDADKRSNIIVAPDGRPFLVDFQISIRRRADWPGPVRRLVSACVDYMQRCDIYHLYKHKRRMSPHELTGDEDSLGRRRGRLHTLHRKLTDPWRVLHRWFLRRRRRPSASRGADPSPNRKGTARPATQQLPR